MTKLSFTIESDAPYSEDEINDLKDSFVSFMEGIDDEIDGESAEIAVVNQDDEKAKQERIREAAIELIESGSVAVSVVVRDVDGDELLSEKLSTDD